MVKTTASKLRTAMSDHTYSMTHTSNLITWQRMQALEAVRCMKKSSARVVLPRLNLGLCHTVSFKPVKVVLSDVFLSSETKVSKPSKKICPYFISLMNSKFLGVFVLVKIVFGTFLSK